MMELAQGANGGGILGAFWPLILMFAIFYFLVIRPQQKRQRQRLAMLDALKLGDQIVTIGGIHGTIVELKDDIVRIEVADNTRITMEKHAINQVRESENESDE